jgi:hypothetical protein
MVQYDLGAPVLVCEEFILGSVGYSMTIVLAYKEGQGGW